MNDERFLVSWSTGRQFSCLSHTVDCIDRCTLDNVQLGDLRFRPELERTKEKSHMTTGESNLHEECHFVGVLSVACVYPKGLIE